MGLWDRLLGRDEQPQPAEQGEVAAAPTAADINASLDGVERLVADPAVPGVVRARALSVTRAVRKTLPRLDLLGLGSYDSYSVVATATDYLRRRSARTCGCRGTGPTPGRWTAARPRC